MAMERGIGLSPSAQAAISRLQVHPLIAPVTETTVEHYARVKSLIAVAKFPNTLAKLGKRKLGKPDTWIDEITGYKLGIDQNDLWICAMALERNLHLVTFDNDMAHVKSACPDLRLTLLS